MRDKYIVDTRIHCCLYFIAPTGHSLKAIDITVMKKLSEVVNVVPIIAKADGLTLEEREVFKQRVSRTFGISISSRALTLLGFVLGLCDNRSGRNWTTTTFEFTPSTTRTTMRKKPS